MEKINTPLMDLIQSERDMLRMANSAIDLSKDDEEVEFFRHEKDKHLYAISILQPLFPTERDMIEKAFNSGATASNLSVQGKDYFTQTFKSYE